jgi:hypothetical protein
MIVPANRVLLIGALVLFIIGALLAFGVFGTATLGTIIGLGLLGLACWVAAGLV